MKLNIQFKNLILNKIAAKFPAARTGKPLKMRPELAIESLFRLIRTGSQWRECDVHDTSVTTVYRHCRKWMDSGIFEEAYRHILRFYHRRIKQKYFCVDSTMVKNIYGTDCVGRNPTDRGRKATKLSTIVDQNGVMFALNFSPANRNDVTLLVPTLQATLVNLQKLELYADKGYDLRSNHNVCNQFGLKDRISRRRTKVYRRANSKRVIVENSYSWMDKARRLIVRYEKFVFVYKEMLFLYLSHLTLNRFDILL